MFYHHCQESVFGGLSLQGRERLIVPSESVQDTTDYIQASNALWAGILFKRPMLGLMRSFLLGVLLRDTHGHERLTVCDHGFIPSNEVFHPSNSGTQIGEIDERWKALDIALVKLNASIPFTNQKCFEAKAPRRLLRSDEIAEGSFCVDGMSTEAVFLHV